MTLCACLGLGTADGSKPRQLTFDGDLKLAPVFVDGGAAVVFSAHREPNRVGLTRMNLKDGKQRLLYPSLTPHQYDAAFSADGRFHCYVMSSISPQLVLVFNNLAAASGKQTIRRSRARDDGTSEIVDQVVASSWVFRAEGARSTARTPRFMPDNSRIVFTLSGPGGRQIVSLDVNGKDLRRLTQSAGINCWPAISPDGRKIAFSSSRNGTLDLYLMNIDGSDVTRLTNMPARNIHTAWSPDGRRIAFTSARDGNDEIYVMQADGSHVLRVTHHPERDQYPTWHPDGRHVLAASERDGRFDLYLFEVPN
jgi:Tol biopolymer transport system component